jgi:hypothetical protein
MTAARPGVGADRTTQQSLLPADGRGFGAAAGHTHANGGVAAAAGRSHAQADFNRSGWTAARIAGLDTLTHQRTSGHDGHCQYNTMQHKLILPSGKHFAGITPAGAGRYEDKSKFWAFGCNGDFWKFKATLTPYFPMLPKNNVKPPQSLNKFWLLADR